MSEVREKTKSSFRVPSMAVCRLLPGVEGPSFGPKSTGRRAVDHRDGYVARHGCASVLDDTFTGE